jgi:predicted membrane protein
MRRVPSILSIACLALSPVATLGPLARAHEPPAQAPSLSAPHATAASASVGLVDFANSGAKSAQADFHYGVAQLHNFQYDEAEAAALAQALTATLVRSDAATQH